MESSRRTAISSPVSNSISYQTVCCCNVWLERAKHPPRRMLSCALGTTTIRVEVQITGSPPFIPSSKIFSSVFCITFEVVCTIQVRFLLAIGSRAGRTRGVKSCALTIVFPKGVLGTVDFAVDSADSQLLSRNTCTVAISANFSWTQAANTKQQK